MTRTRAQDEQPLHDEDEDSADDLETRDERHYDDDDDDGHFEVATTRNAPWPTDGVYSTDGPFGYWCPVLAVLVVAVLLVWLGFLTVVVYRGSSSSTDSDSAALLWNASRDGFYEATMSDDKRAWRRRYLDTPSRDNVKTWLAYYTSTAHVAGSAEDWQQVQWTLAKLNSWGVAAETATYQVMRTMPLQRRVVLRRDDGGGVQRVELSLSDAYELSASAQPRSVVPTFHGYSPSGSVDDAPLVYANFCAVDDFAYLRSCNVSLRGAVVLCRYKRLFRGIKVQLAQLHGAAAVLIFSDPQQDGDARGPAYPAGPWRPRSAVERGSVQFLSVYSGDPLTPSGPSLPGTARIAVRDANVPSIPSLPISADDALPLLRALSTPSPSVPPVATPASWSGALVDDAVMPAYAIGPGAARVDFHYQAETTVDTNIWNVVATFTGAVEPDRLVLLGNHRDAWTFGAADPNSGTAALLELLRSFAELRRAGWSPRRTIVACSWDMEEYGLVGSTEWVEQHAEQLSQQAVAYVNVDEGVTGAQLAAAASPALAGLVRYAARHVAAPYNASYTLYDTWPAEPFAPVGDKSVGLLGSGSDFTPFLQHLGVASIDMQLAGSYGVYHSVLDEFAWMQSFGDPDFSAGRAVAQLWGFVVLTLADAIILPFDHRETALQLAAHTDAMRARAAELACPLDFGPLHDSVAAFSAAAMSLHSDIVNAASLTDDQIRHINDRLYLTERHFLTAAGLPGRPFYRHQVYAPGLFAGYSASIFPALDEALQNRDPVAGQAAVRLLADLIDNAAVCLTD